MRLLITFIGSLLLAVTAVAQPTIWAYRSYQPYDKPEVTGPIKFLATDPMTPTLIADQSRMGHVYAGTYFNYKWYCQVTHVGTQTQIDGLYTIDMNDGSREFVATSNRAMSDMTHDYTTGITYGIVNGAANLATIDLKTGVVVTGASFTNAEGSQRYILALAADLDGTLYGVATDNNFYTIDKSTGVCTLVGPTGRDAAYTQTMAFDHYTHTLYWVNNGDYCVYSIDLATGKATYLGYCDSLNAFAIPYIHASQGAPDRVTGRKATLDGSSVILAWTNPATDTRGNDLAGLDGVKVYRDGTLVTTVALTAGDMGKASTWTDVNVAAGPHAYKIVPFNANGDGGADSDNVKTHVGPNPPGAVGSFTVTPGNYNAVLSWTPPTQGMYGGEFDPESITLYQITRVSGANRSNFSIKAPNTTYTDKPGFGTYTYIIKAINDQGNGEEVTSQPVMVKYDNWIVMGKDEVVAIDKDTKYKFYDNGATGYYTNSVDETLTIKPADAGCVVSAKFSQFRLDVYGDTLIVWDGPDKNSPLVGRFTATSVPAQLSNLRATNTDGALTFRFVSDIMETSTGWLAEVTSTQYCNHDLVAEALTGLARPTQHKPATCTLRLSNQSFNNVAGSDYTVKLLDEGGNVIATAHGTDVEALKTAQVTIEYSPVTEGKQVVKAEIAYAADEDVTNNVSPVLNLDVCPVGSTYVAVETPGTGVFVYPASFYSNESVAETVYGKDLINISHGKLTSVSFPVTSTKNYTSIPVTMYLGETDKDNIEERAIPASQLTKVYEGNLPITTKTSLWEFVLDTPYDYNGGNLVIMVHKVAPGTNGQGVVFAGSYCDGLTEPKRSRAASTYYDTEHLDLESNFGWAAPGLADVNLLFTGQPSGVTTVSISSLGVTADGRTLTVSGAQGKPLAVYTLDGRTVATTQNARPAHTVTVPSAGMYIIKAGTASAKVIVR